MYFTVNNFVSMSQYNGCTVFSKLYNVIINYWFIVIVLEQ